MSNARRQNAVLLLLAQECWWYLKKIFHSSIMTHCERWLWGGGRCNCKYTYNTRLDRSPSKSKEPVFQTFLSPYFRKIWEHEHKVSFDLRLIPYSPLTDEAGVSSSKPCCLTPSVNFENVHQIHYSHKSPFITSLAIDPYWVVLYTCDYTHWSCWFVPIIPKGHPLVLLVAGTWYVSFPKVTEWYS